MLTQNKHIANWRCSSIILKTKHYSFNLKISKLQTIMEQYPRIPWELLRYKSEGRGFDSRWYHWNFSMTKSFRPHYGPGVDSASNRNKYQEYFLGLKAAGAYSWQPYHLHVPTVLKSGSLNLLELSKPVQACNGIALPFFTLGTGRVSLGLRGAHLAN